LRRRRRRWRRQRVVRQRSRTRIERKLDHLWRARRRNSDRRWMRGHRRWSRRRSRAERFVGAPSVSSVCLVARATHRRARTCAPSSWRIAYAHAPARRDSS
jgi:hypothetical protein